MKRALDGDATSSERREKRLKLVKEDRLSCLSDELILRILSLLTISEICSFQRLSHKLERLASDSALWRTQYFERFVKPRSSRLPGLKGPAAPETKARFTTRPSKWLDEQHLVDSGVNTDWKQQYRLRHNWSRGACGVGEITVAEEPHIPPMVVQMHNGVIFTADIKNGLRAWAAKGQQKLLATVALVPAGLVKPSRSPPTSMTVDDCVGKPGSMNVAIGFEDGIFHLYRLQSQDDLSAIYRQETAEVGVVTSLAISWPFLLTMSAMQRLTLYRFPAYSLETNAAPELVHTLKAHNVWTPLSTSLRQSCNDVVVSVAYALPTYLSGWTVGIQEICLSIEGRLLSSRTASAIDQHYRPLAFAAPPFQSHLRAAIGLRPSSTEFRHIHSKPNSLSYTHPYLLVSHPDNTLTLYLVFSNSDALTISVGSRLWGHTSSVSGAHVGGRGKAVSISRRGDELRIWELEGGFVSETARKRLASNDLSVRVKPSSSRHQSGIDVTNIGPHLSVDSDADELTITRGWIGFDAENVAVLREDSDGKQALVVYDFT